MSRVKVDGTATAAAIPWTARAVRSQADDSASPAKSEATVDEAGRLDPWEGITTWLRRFVEYVATKRAVATGIDHDSDVYRACTQALYEAGGPLLQRAQRAGLVRLDVDIDDVMRLVMAYTVVNFASPEQRDRMLGVAFDGLAGGSGASPRPRDT